MVINPLLVTIQSKLLEDKVNMILEENKDLNKLVRDMSQQINDLEREAQNRKYVYTDTGLKYAVRKDKRLLMNGLVPQQETDIVAFSATLNHVVTLGTHQAIEYDNVITNIGHAYDARHGHFIVPFKGLYLISVTGYNSPAVNVFLELVRNSQVIFNMYSDGRGGGQSGLTETLILSLDKGDMVWVRGRSSGNDIYGFPTENCNSFSGYSLQKL
ncbi:complement C1q-like protein 4 [Mytilus trossulus]|uniref:complement C1q-like protein 4 n=1 Tax=Mytilus trossulus TaxID=6551 RepID=UPI003003B873